MDVIYTKSSREYKGNEVPEGPYRLEGVRRIGRKVVPELDAESLAKLVHSSDHLEKIESAGKHNRMLAEVFTDSVTYPAALKSVMLAAKAAREGHFACTRPPGHHATEDTAKGFCFLNNIAIVSRMLSNDGKRVCIFDIDGHQGDGTDHIFFNAGEILFISIHQEFAYPYFYLGHDPAAGYDVTVDHRGENTAEGLHYNMPVPENSGDDVLLDFTDRMLPVIESFDPDVIGISAGFDGYHQDSLLNLNYSQSGYHEFGKRIASLGNELFGLLEGGYHSDVVECIEAMVAGVNGTEYTPEDELSESSEEVFERYREYAERRI
ncbi:MAG: hypothetical protein K9N53_05985 [Candidatus Marinimicrobia bacterium]|nr:hypothetical protein [Candidatus Neomarinimicrobiota bacterium]MCF7828503.1 hypothetical protein [Candidatus Neomarinimicrobiota bacterium]